MVLSYRCNVTALMRDYIVCVVDPTDKMARTAKYWKLKQKLKDDALARGTWVTVGPTTYAGIARVKSIYRDFRSFFSGGAWEIHQTRVFDMFCNANIKKILGDDIDSCLDYVMWENGWKEIHSNVFVQAYRGAGKSAMASGAMAAFLANIPNYTLTMYGGPKEKAIDLFETFTTYLQSIFDKDPDRAAKMRYTKVEKRIRLSAGPGDVRWVALQLSRGNVRFYAFLCTAPPPQHHHCTGTIFCVVICSLYLYILCSTLYIFFSLRKKEKIPKSGGFPFVFSLETGIQKTRETFFDRRVSDDRDE
jgi:hypothetical protein